MSDDDLWRDSDDQREDSNKDQSAKIWEKKRQIEQKSGDGEQVAPDIPSLHLGSNISEPKASIDDLSDLSLQSSEAIEGEGQTSKTTMGEGISDDVIGSTAQQVGPSRQERNRKRTECRQSFSTKF